MIPTRKNSRSQGWAPLTASLLMGAVVGAFAADTAPNPKLEAMKARLAAASAKAKASDAKAEAAGPSAAAPDPTSETTTAEQPRGPMRLTFDDFDLIVKRNIFDPDRKKLVPRADPGPRLPPPPPRNNIVLKGTMKIDQVQFASFDSSLSDYRGRFNKDSDIGEFKLTDVTGTNATLKLDTNKFILRVGEGLSRTGQDPWTAAGKSSYKSGASFAASSGGGSSSSSSTSAASSSAAAPTGEAKMSLIERLKARRAKAAAEGK